MARAYVGIGSNVGDRADTIDRAVRALTQTPGITVAAVSPLAETGPVGGPEGQGPFLNGAAALDTSLEPEALLDALQTIERDLGRRRSERWGPRTIDLDLLLYDERIIAHARLTVPHARLRERRFVLEPLAAIAPEAVDPVTGLSVRRLLEDLDG